MAVYAVGDAEYEIPDSVQGEQLTQVLTQLAGQHAPQSQDVPRETSGSFLQDAKRGLGLGARSTVEGSVGSLAGIADLAALPFNAAYRSITGNQDDLIPSYRQSVTGALDSAGLPIAQSGAERVLDTATRGVAGTPLGLGAGKLLSGAANPVTAGVGNLLMAAPGAQAVAGGSAGASSQLAAEAGLSPEAQQVAGLVGGIAGGGITQALSPAAAERALPVGAATTPERAQALRAVTESTDTIAPGMFDGTPEYASAVSMLKKANIPLTKGQESGTNWVKSSERTLSEIPFSGKPLQRQFESQHQSYQKALLEKAGNIRGDKMVTRQTLENTADDLSKAYVKALAGKKVNIGSDEFLDDLARVEEKNLAFVDDPAKAKVRSVVGQFLEKAAAKEEVTGEWYQAQRSLFAKRAKGTGELAELYGDLKTVLDDAFRRGAGNAKGDLDSKWARYQQLKTIYERNGGPAASEGFISPVAVAREAAGSPGGKEWQDFTRAAAAVLPDRLGNSGTAQRNFILGLAGGSVPAAAIEPMSLATLIAGAGAARGASSILARGGASQPLLNRIENSVSPLLLPSGFSPR